MRLSAVLLTGTVLASATPAFAAEATTSTTDGAAAAAAAQPAATAPAQEVQPGDQAIVVTARKREETLQNVPVAVTAVSGDIIERRGFQQIKDSAKDMATSVQQSGEKASKGLGGIGAGVGDTTAKIDGVTRSIIGSVQRTTAALEAGGKANSDYFRLLAQQRGASVEALAPYLAQLDAVTVKTKAATAAADSGSM